MSLIGLEQVGQVAVKNVSADTIPSFAVMAATSGEVDAEGDLLVYVGKAADNVTVPLFNGFSPIPPGGIGIGVRAIRPTLARIASGSSIGITTKLAPTGDDWDLEENEEGKIAALFQLDGQDIVVVVELGGAGAGEDCPCGQTTPDDEVSLTFRTVGLPYAEEMTRGGPAANYESAEFTVEWDGGTGDYKWVMDEDGEPYGSGLFKATITATHAGGDEGFTAVYHSMSDWAPGGSMRFARQPGYSTGSDPLPVTICGSAYL